MANKDFIELDYYGYFAFKDGSTNSDLLRKELKSVFVRLDSFLEIGKLETHKVYSSGDLVETIKVSHSYLNRLIGRGINGISTDIYLTEDSYEKLIIALGL